jgi:hypothetical protein
MGRVPYYVNKLRFLALSAYVSRRQKTSSNSRACDVFVRIIEGAERQNAFTVYACDPEPR